MDPVTTKVENTYYVNPDDAVVDLDSLDEGHRGVLDRVNRRIGALESIEQVMDMLFEETADICGGDRIGMAFVDESGERLVSHYVRAGYEPVHLGKGFNQELSGSSLAQVIKDGSVRIINDLEQYLRDHPDSVSTALLVGEGVRSSMSCPLKVDDRPVGVLFRSSLAPGAFNPMLASLHLTVAERMGQAVEKAYRIEQLEQANRAYMEMLGFVVHELKSPLGNIVTNAQVILQGYLGEVEERQRAKIGKMVEKADYLLGLINEYLNLARIEGGELEVSPTEGVDIVRDVIAPVIEGLGDQAALREISLETELPSASIVISADAHLLRIAVANLVGNGVKYAFDGGEVTVKVSSVGEFVRVEVHNTGPGFPEDQKDRLFRRFSRVKTKELMSRKGTGVGLYTTAKIVRQHGGRLGAKSEEGKWAAFWFEVPVSFSGART